MKIKYLVIIFTVYTLPSCHFFGQDARMTLAWYNREMILPSGLPCKMMGKDTVAGRPHQNSSKKFIIAK